MATNLPRESVDQFIHDICSPILIIGLAIEEFQQEIANPEVDQEKLQKLTKMLTGNLTRLNGMIADYRNIRRAEREKLVAKKEG